LDLYEPIERGNDILSYIQKKHSSSLPSFPFEVREGHDVWNFMWRLSLPPYPKYPAAAFVSVTIGMSPIVKDLYFPLSYCHGKLLRALKKFGVVQLCVSISDQIILRRMVLRFRFVPKKDEDPPDFCRSCRNCRILLLGQPAQERKFAFWSQQDWHRNFAQNSMKVAAPLIIESNAWAAMPNSHSVK